MSPAFSLVAASEAGLLFSPPSSPFVMPESSQKNRLRYRRGKDSDGGDAGDDDDDDDDGNSSRCANGVCVVCVHTTICATITSTPAGAVPTLPTSSASSSSITSSPSLSTPTSMSASSLTSMPNPSLSQTTYTLAASMTTQTGDAAAKTQSSANIPHHSRVAVGTIVGAVIGSVIGLGLILMMVHRFVSRKRRALKRPSGFVGASYFDAPGSGGGTGRSLPNPETSQTQTTPLISSAMALHLASHNSTTPYSTTPSSVYSSTLPLPVTMLSSAPSAPHRSVSASTSSHPRTSLSEATDISSQWPHDALLNPYEIPPPVWSVANANPTSPANDITGSPSPRLARESQALPVAAAFMVTNADASVPSPSGSARDSALLHSMTTHQKALEADGERAYADDAGNSHAGPSGASESKKDNRYDPPPQYRD